MISCRITYGEIIWAGVSGKSFFIVPSCCRSFNLVADNWIPPEEYPRFTLAPSCELWSDPCDERLRVWPQCKRNFTLGFLLDLFKREAPKTSTTQIGRTMMSYMEYSQQKYVIHVIYGHGAQTISCNFWFPGSDPFGSWNLLDTIRASCVCRHNFSDKNNLEIQEEKTFTGSYMIDVCTEKARTPKPANYKLPSPKQRWKKYVGSKVPSDYTKGLYVLTWSWNSP
jgi:hypothetical protein